MQVQHPEADQDIYMEISIKGFRKGQIYEPKLLGSGNQTKETYDMIMKVLSDTLFKLGVDSRVAMEEYRAQVPAKKPV